MRKSLSGLTLVASLAALTACGGGGSSSNPPPPPPPPPPNVAPVANAGPNQSVNGGTTVTLVGSGTDSDGTIASYAWTQTAGTPVTLSSATVAQPTFTAPGTSGTLTFSLTVKDDDGASSSAVATNVTVIAGSAGTVTGKIEFIRVPFDSSIFNGLDYGNQLRRPARGVTVRALSGATELAKTTTDSGGLYSVNVTAGANITIQVVAEMVKTGTPSWNFSVSDLGSSTTATPPYTFTDNVQVAATAGANHDVLIPSGFDNSAKVIGTRASAPFAILDTLYQGYQLVLSAKSDIAFPALVVDWATDNTPSDGTFYSSGPLQHIVLTADVTADTDEFDQHVIAHEFGHYIEHNFSRADNIGGSHGLGDKLDPRVAFGEGFGYAFGAMVLNDSLTRDSFVDSGTQRSSNFDVETNPPVSGGGTSGNFGCWCSESSVWAILWDVYDQVPDPSDTVTLGFIPIWNVLTGSQKDTPAFTTIFSFITALKTQNASSTTAINALVAAQNINSNGIDIYGSAETNFPTPFTNVAVLPIYATATIGGAPVVLRSSNAGGPSAIGDSGNKLSNHRFIRFTGDGQNVTVTATSNSPSATRDVDFLVYRATPFAFYRTATTGPSTSGETLTFPTASADYLIDVYDCANGCDSVEATPGNYDLTVTITH